MGAAGVQAFRHMKTGRHVNVAGQEFETASLLAWLKVNSLQHPVVVQPWLKNHPEIADLTKDSLIAIRVITCMNEAGVAEVTLAMLRILSELEPAWSHLPDEEYAAPIDIESGRMGLLAGDKMFTTLQRYECHPVTGSAINGRTLSAWPAIRDLAIKAHTAFPHRLMLGWDIAWTPDGPLVLEGNTNFDVMLLQRVHDAPVSNSRFGELMNYHLDTLYHRKVEMS